MPRTLTIGLTLLAAGTFLPNLLSAQEKSPSPPAAKGDLADEPALADLAPGVETPVAQLAATYEKFIKDNPKHEHLAEAWYRLGRVHYLAYALATDKVAVVTPVLKQNPDPFNNLPLSVIDRRIAGRPDLPAFSTRDPKEPEPVSDPAELRAAIAALRQAISLDDKSARYHLVLGCAAEAAINAPDKTGDLARDAKESFSKLLNNPPVGVAADNGGQGPNVLAPAEAWRILALREYTIAYEGAIKGDLKLDHQPMAGLASLVGYTAAKNFLRMEESRHSNTPDEKIAHMCADVETLDKLPRVRQAHDR